MATAKRLKKWVMPWMRPRSDGANQSCMARLATGNAPASPMPSRSLAVTSEPKPVATPVNIADVDVHAIRMFSTLLGPEAVAEPADRNLTCCVRPGESGEDETHLGQRQAERLANLRLCDGDDAPIQVADQVHQAEQHQHPPSRARGRDALVDHALLQQRVGNDRCTVHFSHVSPCGI